MNPRIYRLGMRHVRRLHSWLGRINRDEERPVHVRLLAYQWANLVFSLHTLLFNAAMREFGKRMA